MFGMHILDILVILVYMIAMIGIGIFTRKRIKNNSRTGFLIKASKFASSSGLYFSHNPPFPLNVGTPLSCEIPAPQITTTFFDDFNNDFSLSENSIISVYFSKI
jgi:hypothetical protein